MGIEQALNNLEPKPLGKECSVALLYRSLDKADANALGLALMNHNLAASQIARALKSEGIELSINTINRHRRRAAGTGCLCP